MTDQLRDYARQLKLGNIEELYDRVEFKEKRQYLTDLLELMLEQRRAKRADRLIKKAGFPTIKTLEGYDFSPITFPAGLNRAALEYQGVV